MKHYRLEKHQIKALAEGYGLAMVSDMVTVEGYTVAYMYRDEPEEADDSGWRFFAGNESDAYLDNAKNFSLLDVNIVANYDPTIISHLDAPVGAAFDKGEEGETFYDVSE